MSAPEQHPGFPIDDPAAVVADLRGRLDALASRMVDVGQATLGRDPVVMALVDHQRHKPDRCLCGWGELGKSHAEHVAGIVRPLIEAELRRELEVVTADRDILREWAAQQGISAGVARRPGGHIWSGARTWDGSPRPGGSCRCWCPHDEDHDDSPLTLHDAKKVADRKKVEAEVRERVAREIEAADCEVSAPLAFQMDCCTRQRQDARIARGSNA